MSKRELQYIINNKEYERLDDKTKNKLINKEEIKVTDLVKNPIIIKNNLDIIDVNEKYLKKLILEDLDDFLKELGEGFLYVGNEYKIRVGNTFNYIDILLFNIKYNCYVVVELKVVELMKEHIGQIMIYMNYIDKWVKEIYHDKTIGIIICKRDNKLILEYYSDTRIFSTTYKFTKNIVDIFKKNKYILFLEVHVMNLVIVESPAKSKTIEKYLGKDYKVVSSVGHIRDLSTKGKYGLGVDVENDFKPDYEPMPSKKKVISELKKLVKDADKVYLATDPDREGEAISWHLFDTLKIKENSYLRVLFYEITKDKVLEGLANPRKIDYNLVKSQETRRILDRIIGFRLSKLMQNKTGGKSAGRVQSVALKLVVDREREILAFKSTPYYTITAKFPDKDMESELYAENGKDLEIVEKDVANDILSKLSDTFTVSSVDKKKKNRASKFPFTTSTLQQEASTKLGFPAKKTMSIAQKLYEGLDIGSEHTGLITYMRTDSVRLSEEFTGLAFHFIEENFGKEYVGYVKKSKKQENVQDAHEGIRPTSIFRTPKSLEKHLTSDELKLYTLIYYRTVASLMADAKTDVTTIILDNNGYNFKSSGTVITFDGYLKVYSKYEEANDTILPVLNVGEILQTKEIVVDEHFTKPKSRYTEAKLIHELEELGIGRPSTYATIMSNIRERGYVEVIDKKFAPTEIGFTVTDKLQEFFSNIINVKYTANMEKELDEIADGLLDNIKVLHEFYDVFDETLHEAFTKMERTKPTETGEVCPNCGSPLVLRKGKYGEFTACSNYPDCTYVKKDEKEEKPVVEIMNCPKCDGKIIEKTTKKGKTFYGCNHFPKCKEAVWDKPTGEICPKCGGLIVETKDGNKCNDCNYQV